MSSPLLVLLSLPPPASFPIIHITCYPHFLPHLLPPIFYPIQYPSIIPIAHILSSSFHTPSPILAPFHAPIPFPSPAPIPHLHLSPTPPAPHSYDPIICLHSLTHSQLPLFPLASPCLPYTPISALTHSSITYSPPLPHLPHSLPKPHSPPSSQLHPSNTKLREHGHDTETYSQTTETRRNKLYKFQRNQNPKVVNQAVHEAKELS